MKTKILITTLVLILPTIASAQNQTRERRSTDSSTQPAARERVVSTKALNHFDNRKAVADSTSNRPATPDISQTSQQPAWGNSSVPLRTPEPIANNALAATPPLTKPTPLSVAQPAKISRTSNAVRTSPASVYAVGIGDVLDVRLSNLTTRESTLFTVMKDGTLEYPLVGTPVRVVGLTTDEIASLLAGQIKVLNSPQVIVNVRDFASHSVVVTGAVTNPGRKVLRREAMPLFAVLAEALVRPEATTAVVIHNGKEGAPLNLKDEKAMAAQVVSGDVVKIIGAEIAASGKFIYVGGQVSAPGEKTFRTGMTLTQAILSAGGTQRSGKTAIKISRRNQGGFLVTSEYQLNSIVDGKAQDPQLEPGDRIEVIGNP